MLDGLSGLFSSRVRLDVVAALLSGPKSFTTLKQLTGATDGNLGRQLEVLVQAGAVAGERALVGKRAAPLTPSPPPAGPGSAPMWRRWRRCWPRGRNSSRNDRAHPPRNAAAAYAVAR